MLFTARVTPALTLALATGLAQPTFAHAADADRGRTLFAQNCAVCHATGTDVRPVAGQGPLLAGVLGRPAASLPNFGYSRALQGSHLTWDAPTLNRFLAGPQVVVPGTLMVVSVASSSDRDDLVAYLATLKPVALPTDAAAAPAAPSAGDWHNDAPGVRHRFTVNDLPPPFLTPSAGNSPRVVDRPQAARLAVPAGFRVAAFATGLSGPRLLRTAPNGDIFVAETAAGSIRVLRMSPGADHPSQVASFARDLEGPFGIAFYPSGPNPEWVYVGLRNAVIRLPYRNGDLSARGEAQTIVRKLANTSGGHTTRDVVFTLDDRRLLISVGSGSNVAEGIAKKQPDEVQAWESEHGVGADWGSETNRANVLVTDPEGRTPLRRYATGIRNPVGEAIDPGTGVLWVSTNERDGLGDNLVPDYITRVQEGGFYGWPWYYLGNHEEPRHHAERPDLAGKAIVPDVLIQSHSASLQLTFYPLATGVSAFPSSYTGDIFACEHGSWNRAVRTGSKVIRVRVNHGVPTGEYEDFLTGFVVDDRRVWGRPVGVTVAADGSLLVSDDAGDTIWRVSIGSR